MANLSSVARSAYSDLLRLLKDDMITNVRGSLMTKERGGKLYWYAAEKIGNAVKFWYIGPDSHETRDPENPALTWSGRGRKPRWFVDALAAGKTEDDLTIT